MVLLHEKFSGHPTHGVEGVVRVGMGGAFDQTGRRSIRKQFLKFCKLHQREVLYFPTTIAVYFTFSSTCKEKVSELVAVHRHNLLLLALHQQTLRPFPLNINILLEVIKIDIYLPCPRSGRCWRATYLTPAFSMKTRNCTN